VREDLRLHHFIDIEVDGWIKETVHLVLNAAESRLVVAKQLDPKTIADAERRADAFIPRQ
jgi:formylmethanofuran dehydrogenase subunit E-like metal-binding protein